MSTLQSRVAAIAVILILTSIPLVSMAQAVSSIPLEISDGESFRIISEFSEPNGAFSYENFISNEPDIQDVVPGLKRLTVPGGVYLGVAPEQNFTYVAAIRPAIAFIIDIRRQNTIELLMYKALFEMAADRSDFVSRLFSRKRPAGLTSSSSAEDIFHAYEAAPGDQALYRETLQAIKDSLIRKHGFKPVGDDEKKIDYLFDVFFRGGPSMTSEFGTPSPAAGTPTYTQLMTARDKQGQNGSFLASEDDYRFVREMQHRNLIVPVVGDFAGSSAIRKVSAYLKENGAKVTVFYVSNVELYLRDQKLQDFYGNVAALPIDSSSLFIRWLPNTRPLTWWTAGMSGTASVLSPVIDLVDALKAGHAPTTYVEAIKTIPDPTTLTVRR